MTHLTKLLSCLLIAVLFLAAGCTPASNDPSASGNDAQATETPASATPAPTLEPVATPPAPQESLGENLIPAISSNFDSAAAVSDTAWTRKYGGPTVSLGNNEEDGTVCLKFEKNTVASAAFHSAAINLRPYITQAGEYRISFSFMVESTKVGRPFYCAIRTGAAKFSFTSKTVNKQAFMNWEGVESVQPESWEVCEFMLTIGSDDLSAADASNAVWDFCLHEIRADVSAVYIDDFEVRRVDVTASEFQTDSAITWVANEFVFLSSTDYADPLFDAEADLILTKGDESYTIPLFWDGGIIWRVRFTCPSEGDWTWRTVCTDTANTGLHGRTGTVHCTKYAGPLAIYQHGFVKTQANTKYFLYDDGTPFFYLGDTHWGLGGEPIVILDEVLKVRAQQGFTVIQSEPIDAGFNMSDGVSFADIKGFRAFDEAFAHIASYGLVHANAEFFFSSNMEYLISNFGGYSDVLLGEATHRTGKYKMYDFSKEFKTALKTLARYWVARYSAYPVMWTLGQEVDNDYFWHRDDFHGHDKWSYYNNPYRLLASYIGQCDPYQHPLSAHQEHTQYTKASTSAFRDISAHTWYAAQWSQEYSEPINIAVPQDYWAMGQGKPVVLYEGYYCYLWTKDFGARLQGWMAFLNGMCGYGWGGQNTWCYRSTYSMESESTDGVDTVTITDKQATWEDALAFASPQQCGYMRRFFEENVGDWYNLIPRFSASAYFRPDTNLFMMAGNADNSKIVIYFYNFSDPTVGEKPNAPGLDGTKTGTLRGLKSGETYSYEWFDPATGQVTETGTFTASSEANATWVIPAKAETDMVLYVHR